MARAPSDAGKTRLAPYLTLDRLHALRVALLYDALRIAALLDGTDPRVFMSGSADLSGERVPRRSSPVILASEGGIVPQTGDDLGQRMAPRPRICSSSADTGRRCSSEPARPFLLPAHIAEARDTLAANNGIVLGPADDGGYYLIGMTRLHAGLFDPMAWSTASVLTDTLRAAGRLGVEARLMPSLYDIDTIGDRRRAERNLATAAPDVAPSLRIWFRDGSSRRHEGHEDHEE